MEKLIPDVQKEMDAIAIRILVMKMEHLEYKIIGMLASLKGHLNIMCMNIGEQGGEHGKIWDDELRESKDGE